MRVTVYLTPNLDMMVKHIVTSDSGKCKCTLSIVSFLPLMLCTHGTADREKEFIICDIEPFFGFDEKIGCLLHFVHSCFY
jgi:hypothetical protein